jgi:hypothetical protein
MNASMLTTQLEFARDRGHRVALGFQHRLMMIEQIHTLGVTDLAPDGADGTGQNAAYELVGMLYDTAHSRNATLERVFFESGEVVYLARPETTAQADAEGAS